MTAEQKQALIDEIVIQALRDDVRQWQQRAEAAESNSNYNGGDARYWHDEYCAQQQRLVSKIASLEAKLAEPAKQEAIFQVEVSGNHWLNAGPVDDSDFTGLPDGVNLLYARPVPAADLADLVPDDISAEEADAILTEKYGQFMEEHFFCADSFEEGANWRRAQILRNIEEAK